MQDGHLYLWMIATWLGGMLVIVLIDAIREWKNGNLKEDSLYPDSPKTVIVDHSMAAMRRIFE